MDISEANQIIGELSEDKKEILETAHWRYMCFAGVTSVDEASDRQAATDRITFAHLLKYNEKKQPVVSDEATAEFMAAVSGMPKDYCLAWDERDFYLTHGVSSACAAKLGSV